MKKKILHTISLSAILLTATFITTSALTSCNKEVTNTHKVSFNTFTGGKVTINNNTYDYEAGSQVTFKIELEEGYEVVDVTTSNSQIELLTNDGLTYLFVMPNEDVSITVEVVKRVDLNALLNNLKSNKLEVNVDIFTDYSGEGFEEFDFHSYLTQFYGNESYSIYEEDEDGEVYLDEKYYKNAEGNLEMREVEIDNTVVTNDKFQIDETTDPITIPFDYLYGNLFKDVTVDDFEELEDHSGYIAKGANLALAVSMMNYYYTTDKMESYKLIPVDTSTLRFEITMPKVEKSNDVYSYSYVETLTGEVKVSNKEELKVEPFAKESYHDEVASALTKMTEAKTFTYNRTRTSELTGEDYAINGIKIAENALYTPIDPYLGTPEGGYAVYDDNNWYQYEIVNDEPVVSIDSSFGSASETTMLPYLPSIVSPDVFYQKEEGVYATRTDYIASGLLYYLLEGTELILVSYSYYPVGEVELFITDGTLEGFSYTFEVYNSFGLLQDIVYNKVMITNVDETTVDYEFKLDTPDTSWFSSIIGTWEGNLPLLNEEYGVPYTLVITDENTMTLNGEVATNIVINEDKTFTFEIDGVTYSFRVDIDPENPSWDEIFVEASTLKPGGGSFTRATE